MKTMAVVTMVASIATLGLLIFAGAKAQNASDSLKSQIDQAKSNPVGFIRSLFGSTVEPPAKGA